jgi:GxxExxY protein
MSVSDRREPSPELDRLAHEVIGAAIEVHRTLGPGFLESPYEEALCVELNLRGIPFVRQHLLRVTYKDQVIGENHLDLLVGGELIVELKAVDAIAPIHRAQVMSYLKASGFSLALLINFNVTVLRKGIERIVRS